MNKKFFPSIVIRYDDTAFTIFLIISILIGLYVGIWICFIGGIVQIVEAYKSGLESFGIAFGVLRLMLSGVIGFASTYFSMFVFRLIYYNVIKKLTMKYERG